MASSTHKHRRVYLIAALAAFLMLGTAAQAEITPILILSSGTDLAIIPDYDGDGHVSYAGSLGRWALNFASGEQGRYEFELESADIAGLFPRDLTIALIGTGFEAWPGLNVMFEGNLVSIWARMCYSLFVDDVLVGSLGPYSGFDFGGTIRGIPLAPGEHEIAQVIKISGFSGTLAHFNAEVTPTPEPATLLLVGVGLLFGAKFASRRLARQ